MAFALQSQLTRVLGRSLNCSQRLLFRHASSSRAVTDLSSHPSLERYLRFYFHKSIKEVAPNSCEALNLRQTLESIYDQPYCSDNLLHAIYSDTYGQLIVTEAVSLISNQVKVDPKADPVQILSAMFSTASATETLCCVADLVTDIHVKGVFLKGFEARFCYDLNHQISDQSCCIPRPIRMSQLTLSLTDRYPLVNALWIGRLLAKKYPATAKRLIQQSNGHEFSDCAMALSFYREGLLKPQLNNLHIHFLCQALMDTYGFKTISLLTGLRSVQEILFRFEPKVYSEFQLSLLSHLPDKLCPEKEKNMLLMNMVLMERLQKLSDA